MCSVSLHISFVHIWGMGTVHIKWLHLRHFVAYNSQLCYV